MTCIAVISAPRSGSSMVAGILHHMGLRMGEGFATPTKQNPTGYFEDLEFVGWHERFLTRDVTNPRPRLSLRNLTEYKKLIKRREEQFPLYGVKDPRLCYMFPLMAWLSTKPIIVIDLRRDVATSAKSFDKWWQVGSNKAFEIIADYVQAKETSLFYFEGEQHAFHYDQIIESPQSQIERLSQITGKPVTDEALAHVRPDMRHWT